MFTGIIEAAGSILDLDDAGDFRTVRIRAPGIMADLTTGSSIAVNGVCLTARSLVEDTFTAEMSRETLARTTLGNLRKDAIVNLERPMRADSRFGGHIVQGHVDGVGKIREFKRQKDDWDLVVEMPSDSAHYVVEKGSIAIDGISLTVASLRGSGAFSVAIIPHTLENTNLKNARAGDAVNLEFDIIAKYVERMIQPFRRRKKDD